MHVFSRALPVAAAMFFCAPTSHAGVVYNATLGSAGAGTPTSLFGNFTTDDNFALGTFVDSNGDTIEIGLRARYRVRPTQASDGAGVYGPFDAGTQTASHGSPARADRAEWSYDFYIDSNGADLSDLSFSLCGDTNRGAAFAADCMDPLSFGDNRSSGSELGNSFQLLFAGTPGSSGYDVHANGLYDFSLSVFEGADLLGTTSIRAIVGDVSAIPEPATFGLAGFGLAMVAALRRRERAKAK